MQSRHHQTTPHAKNQDCLKLLIYRVFSPVLVGNLPLLLGVTMTSRSLLYQIARQHAFWHQDCEDMSRDPKIWPLL